MKGCSEPAARKFKGEKKYSLLFLKRLSTKILVMPPATSTRAYVCSTEYDCDLWYKFDFVQGRLKKEPYGMGSVQYSEG